MNHPSSITDEQLDRLARQLAAPLQAHAQRLCTAESCTGGWLGKVLTDIAGSSGWFERGFITYSNQAKQDLLGVPAVLLSQYGAVSQEAATAMALGALSHSLAQYSVAITGIAGPGGGTVDKPVGLVWFAWAAEGRLFTSTSRQFAGDRDAVRRQAVQQALLGLLSMLGVFTD